MVGQMSMFWYFVGSFVSIVVNIIDLLFYFLCFLGTS